MLAACSLSRAGRDRHATGLELLHQMVAAGEGVSLIPALAADRLGYADGLVMYNLLGREPIERNVMLVARRSILPGAGAGIGENFQIAGPAVKLEVAGRRMGLCPKPHQRTVVLWTPIVRQKG